MKRAAAAADLDDSQPLMISDEEEGQAPGEIRGEPRKVKTFKRPLRELNSSPPPRPPSGLSSTGKVRRTLASGETFWAEPTPEEYMALVNEEKKQKR